MPAATATAAITSPLSGADFTGRTYRGFVTVTFTAGTYVTGGFAVALQSILGVPATLPPIKVEPADLTNPPSGIQWVWNQTTGKLQGFVTGAAVATPLEEAPNTTNVPAGSVVLEAVFARL